MMYRILLILQILKSCLKCKIDQKAPFYLPAMLIFPENPVCELKH